MAEALLHTSKQDCLGVNAKRTKCMVISHRQSTKQNRNMKQMRHS